MENRQTNFTSGPILGPLLRFALPVLGALFLQSLYGAVDLLIVGHYAAPTDVSAVSTGSQIMMTLTSVVVSLAMGTTILLGQKIGEGKRDEGGAIIGASIVMYGIIGLVLTLLIPLFGDRIAALMNAPAEAFSQTADYIRICGAGCLVIITYNLIGSIFRGIGDSNTPLITVAIACAANVLGDLLLVGVLGMGTAGAALATVGAQLLSVLISFLLIRRKTLPFTFSAEMIRPNTQHMRRMVGLGLPIALQGLLVSISFLVVMALVNELGVTASAGVGVAEKVCAFIMLVPDSFMQAMSAFVAQNHGAREFDRSRKALRYAICVSVVFAVSMFFLSFFRGDLLASIFSSDADVVEAAFQYLKAYAIDCLFTCFLFCMIGYFNGIGCTRFTMVQGLIGAFCVRVPVSYFMSRQVPASLFRIGLATPCSTALQITLCFIMLVHTNKKLRSNTL